MGINVSLATMNELSEHEKAFVGRVFADYKSVLKKSSEKIHVFLQEYPDILDQTGYPLHSLCGELYDAESQPLRALRIRQIQQLMDIDASCLSTLDWDGNSPLHCILYGLPDDQTEDHALMDLLKSMIRVEPNALYIENHNGDTPLHVACSFEIGESALAIVRLFLEVDSELAMVRNYRDELPLHAACSNQPPEVVKLLIHECPESVLMQDANRNTILHEAFGTLDNFQLLVQSCPIALRCKNKMKQTPSHTACEKNASVDVIEFLVQKNREFLGWQDWKG
jgi:ankyrin repeat protein